MPRLGNPRIDIYYAEVDVLRENQSQGRAFVDFESADGAAEFLRGVEPDHSMPLVLAALAVLRFDRKELSLLWLTDRSLTVGLACPIHRQSWSGSGSNVFGGSLEGSCLAFPDFLESFFSLEW